MPDVISGQAVPAADPVAMIASLMDRERITHDTPKEVPQETAQPETDAEVPAQNAEVEGADAQPETEVVPTAEIPLDQLEAIELETTFKAEDGKDVTEKLPIKELRLGYMRTKDYQRKTAEVARQREELGNSVRQGIESERTQYANTLQQLQATLVDLVAPELQNVDWNDLAANNAFEYVRLSNRRDQVQRALQSVTAKQQEIKTKAEADQRQNAQALAQKTWATLESDIPNWNQETYQTVMKAGESIGYSPQEVGSWLDARAIKLLHKAHLYDQLKAGKPSVDKKVAVAPAVIKPGAASVVSPKAQQKSNALEKLRKTGRVDDMASFLAKQM